MYSLIEEEHRRSSHDIAKELKRRSYMERSYDDSGYERDHSYRESSEPARSKSGYDQENIPSRRHQLVSDGYLRGFDESKVRMEKQMNNRFSDVLHRTTSSLSNNSRVGIASVHPY